MHDEAFANRPIRSFIHYLTHAQIPHMTTTEIMQTIKLDFLC